MSSPRTVLVSGASGQLGRAIVNLLLKSNAARVVAATRNPEKLADLESWGVAVRRLDFDDPSSFPAAFAGIERAVIVSTDALGRRVAQHAAAVAAAAAAGVGHLAYTSVVSADRWSFLLAEEHLATERALASSGVPWTALRNNVYTSLLLGLLPSAVASGRLVAAAGDGRVAFVTRHDCARAAATVLLSDAPPSGPVDITGPDALSFADLAALAASVTGRPVAYVPVTREESIRAHVASGVPAAYADVFVQFELAYADGLFGQVADVARLTGQPSTSVREFLTVQRDALLDAPAATH